jgi:hypothetical protein
VLLLPSNALRALPLGFLNGASGLADHVEYAAGVGEHGDVAAGHLDGGCPHALRHEALQLRVDGTILGGEDVPARLRLPCGALSPTTLSVVQ